MPSSGDLPLEFIVEFDRERYENLRKQSRKRASQVDASRRDMSWLLLSLHVRQLLRSLSRSVRQARVARHWQILQQSRACVLPIGRIPATTCPRHTQPKCRVCSCESNLAKLMAAAGPI